MADIDHVQASEVTVISDKAKAMRRMQCPEDGFSCAKSVGQNRGMHSLTGRQAATLLLALGSAAVAAQTVKLPPPSRTVYKCTVEGKTVYSDNPCVGAQRIEIEPTRGMNSMTGKPQTGADVRREQHREAVAEVVRPLTGKDAKGFEKDRRRLQLNTSAQRDCAGLDAALPALERAERAAQPRDLPQAQQALFEARKRYRKLGC